MKTREVVILCTLVLIATNSPMWYLASKADWDEAVKTMTGIAQSVGAFFGGRYLLSPRKEPEGINRNSIDYSVGYKEGKADATPRNVS